VYTFTGFSHFGWRARVAARIDHVRLPSPFGYAVFGFALASSARPVRNRKRRKRAMQQKATICNNVFESLVRTLEVAVWQ
jgi:hypothetical protein